MFLTVVMISYIQNYLPSHKSVKLGDEVALMWPFHKEWYFVCHQRTNVALSQYAVFRFLKNL